MLNVGEIMADIIYNEDCLTEGEIIPLSLYNMHGIQ